MNVTKHQRDKREDWAGSCAGMPVEVWGNPPRSTFEEAVLAFGGTAPLFGKLQTKALERFKMLWPSAGKAEITYTATICSVEWVLILAAWVPLIHGVPLAVEMESIFALSGHTKPEENFPLQIN